MAVPNRTRRRLAIAGVLTAAAGLSLVFVTVWISVFGAAWLNVFPPPPTQTGHVQVMWQDRLPAEDMAGQAVRAAGDVLLVRVDGGQCYLIVYSSYGSVTATRAACPEPK